MTTDKSIKMNISRSNIVIFTISLLYFFISTVDGKQSDRVRLEKIQTLTLQSDRWTSGRRSSPIKQLNCVGGYCSRARVTTAQCYNRGFDGRDVQWECKAEMPSSYKFGKIEVICEGYDYPEDDHVLVGSCGLEYTIEESGNGGGGGGGGGARDSSSWFSSQQHYHAAKQHIDGSDWSIMPIVVIVAFIALIYFVCLRDSHGATRSSASSSHSSDDYPGASAPPPPGFRSEYYDSGSSCSGAAGTRPSGGGTGWGGPGLFSGLAAGGFLGYLFGSSRSNTYGRTRSGYSNAYDGYGPSTSGYSSFSAPTSSSSSSANTHTSSGFGGTRRR